MHWYGRYKGPAAPGQRCIPGSTCEPGKVCKLGRNCNIHGCEYHHLIYGVCNSVSGLCESNLNYLEFKEGSYKPRVYCASSPYNCTWNAECVKDPNSNCECDFHYPDGTYGH